LERVATYSVVTRDYNGARGEKKSANYFRFRGRKVSNSYNLYRAGQKKGEGRMATGYS